MDPTFKSYNVEYWNMPLQSNWPLYIFCVEDVIRSKPTKFFSKGQDYVIIATMIDGGKVFEFKHESFLLKKGDTLIIPESTMYSFESRSSGGYYHKKVVELKGLHLGSLSLALGLEKPFVISEGFDEIVNIMDSAMELLARRSVDDIPELMGIAYKLLNIIALKHRIAGSSENTLLATAQLLLEKDFRNPIPIPKVAVKLGVSRAKLDNLFRRELNMSPLEYRIYKKMDQATHLLKSMHSIKEIAYMLGYCNQFHFANEFKRVKGMSPSAYREADRQQ